MRALLVIVLACVGCIRAATFQCAESDQCVRDGVQGKCETVGYCSFPDPGCASGERFGDFSVPYANQCVGDSDAGMSADAVDDARSPDALGCPSGYSTLPGVPTRQYRKLLTTAPWTNHRTACEAEGGNIYLAIPDDMTELSAIVTFAGADSWIGIDDIAVEGTFQTVRGTTPTFLPWAPGEPDNAGNQDCVEVLAASSKFATLNCSAPRIAVCECEP
jgi:C-type mannose receptor